MSSLVKQTNDVISDTLTRIRNAIMSKKDTVVVKNTKMVLNILNILSKYRFIGSYSMLESNDIEVSLKVDGRYRINKLVRISKPGLRKYVSAKEIKLVKGGKGIGVVSTSKGVISNVQAKKLGVGGEYICQVW